MSVVVKIGLSTPIKPVSAAGPVRSRLATWREPPIFSGQIRNLQTLPDAPELMFAEENPIQMSRRAVSSSPGSGAILLAGGDACNPALDPVRDLSGIDATADRVFAQVPTRVTRAGRSGLVLVNVL